MNKHRHFHWSYCLRFIRKTLVVYLLPLVQVAFQREWEALFTVLWQDLALFCLIALASASILLSSGWRLDEGDTLHLHWDLFVHLDRSIRGGELAAVRIERTLFHHLTGAALLTLYPAKPAGGKPCTLCLPLHDAEHLADRLLPAAKDEVYHPDGGEQLVLALLSANSVTTLLLFTLAMRQDHSYTALPEQLALAQLNHAAAWAARWLPASLAWLFTFLGFLMGISLGRSFLHTMRYHVWRTGGMLCGRGGAIHTFQYRIRTDTISFADVRLSPTARILRRYPVYVAAGSYTESDIPIFIYKPGQEALLERLLPGFRLPPDVPVSTQKRSLALFLPAGAFLGVFLLLTLVSCYALPGLTLVLLFPTGCFFLMLLCAAEGYRYEGAWCGEGRLTLRRQRNFSLHCICIFSPQVSLSLVQSPWATSAQRANLSFCLPGKLRIKVRSIPLGDALACVRMLEQTGGFLPS